MAENVNVYVNNVVKKAPPILILKGKEKRGKYKIVTIDDNPEITSSIVTNARELLAQLNSENFDELLPSFYTLPFENNPFRVSGFIQVLLENVVEKPSNIPIYAQLIQNICKDLSSSSSQTKDDNDNDYSTKQFIKIIRTYFTDLFCKDEDGTGKPINWEALEKVKGITREMKLSGTMSLIVELYRIKYFDAEVIKESFTALTYGGLLDDEFLKCFNFLICSVGQQLDEDEKGNITYPKWKNKTLSAIQSITRSRNNFGVSYQLLSTLGHSVMLWRNGWLNPRKTFASASSTSEPEVPTSLSNVTVQEVRKEVPTSLFTLKLSEMSLETVDASETASSPPLMTEDDPPGPAPSVVSNANDAKVLRDLIRRTRNTLAKLSSDNFEQQKTYFLTLKHLDNKTDRISAFVNIVFEKAIEKPSAASLYARMLVQVRYYSSKSFVMTEVEKETCKKFTNEMHQKCGDELLKIMGNKNDPANANNEMELMEAKAGPETERNDSTRADKLHNLVLFIGELYKEKLISREFIIAQITGLVDDIYLNEKCENVNALCALLKSVGKLLEDEISSSSAENGGMTGNTEGEKCFVPIVDLAWMDGCFKKLESILEKSMISSEQVSAIFKLIELRTNGWENKDKLMEKEDKDLQKNLAVSNVIITPISSTPKDEESLFLQSLARNTQILLDKLCLENLKRNFVTLSYLDNKPERISTFLNVVFKKASERPDRAPMYAKLLNQICFPATPTPEEEPDINEISQRFNFIHQIVQKFKKEFNELVTIKRELREMDRNRSKFILKGSKGKESSIDKEFEKRKSSAKIRSLNLNLFLGELYKAKLISLTTMVAQINSLLNNSTDMDNNDLEENLTCLLALLKSVGKVLENEIQNENSESADAEGEYFVPEVSPGWMKELFEKLETIFDKTNVSGETKELLLEIIELKKNEWSSKDKMSKANFPDQSTPSTPMPLTRTKINLKDLPESGLD